MRTTTKLFVTLLALFVYCTTIFAQPRSESEALELARQFLLEQNTKALNRAQSTTAEPLKLSIVPQTKVEKKIANRAALGTGHASGFYIVNDEGNDRFVIVSGDSRQIKILGYSEKNLFDIEHVPCGLEMMLEQYDKEFEYLQQNTKDVSKHTSRRAFPTVGPIVTTEWDQGNSDINLVGENVFNKFCPIDGSNRSVTGCVATAMAQILNVHKQPSSLASKTISYTTETRGFSLNENMSSLPLNWSDMRDIYRDKYPTMGGYSTTSSQRNAVGYLMYACGLSVHMNYKNSGSGASDNNVPYALTQYFGYNANMRYCERDYYTKDEWDSMIQEELQAGRPVLYGGQSPSGGGHAFIIDGCKSEGSYHINWGWNGSDNGYFFLSTLSSENNYVNEQDMVIGITPNTTGTRTEQFYADAFSMSSTSINIGSSANGTITKPICQSTPAATTDKYGGPTWTGAIGVAVFDTNFNPIKVFPRVINGSENNDYTLGMYWTNPLNTSVTFDSNTFQEGKEYYIAPYAKGASSSAPTRMRTKNAASDYYLAKVSGGKVTLTLMGTPDGGGGGGGGGSDPETGTPNISIASITSGNSSLTDLTKNDVLKFNATFKNSGETANVRTALFICDENFDKDLAIIEDTRSFSANAETTVSYQYSLNNLQAGNYTASVLYYKSWDGTNSWMYNSKYIFKFNVKEVSNPVTSISVSPFALTLNPGGTKQLTAYVQPEDATDKSVSWSSNNTSVATVDNSGLVTGKSAGNATITCTANDGSGKSYTIPVQVLSSGVPKISIVSLTSSNSNLNSLKAGDKLYLRATFKNTGTAANVYTRVVIPNEAGTKVLYGGDIISKSFPNSSSIVYDYEYQLPDDIPAGTYKVYAMYYKSWPNESNSYSYIYDEEKVINITVGSADTPKIVITSATINSARTLTQNDQLSLTTEYQNTGASLDDFKTTIVFLKDGVWYGRGEIATNTFSSGSTKKMTMSLTLNNIVLYGDINGPVEPGTYKVAIMYWDYWSTKKWIYRDDDALFEITVTSGTPVNAIYTDNSDEENAVYYDLSGRRIEKPTKKGIYIRNGKKVLIK